MALVTLEMGPLWKMWLLRDVLEERGVPAFVADSNLKGIDPFITGALPLDARLQVPAEALETARSALAESREDGARLDAEQADSLAQPREPPSSAPDLAALSELGRRIRWASVLPWMHPFALYYGIRYLRDLARVHGRPTGHAYTVLALLLVGALWCLLAFGVLWYGL